MASSSSSEYVIYHPEKLRLLDIFSVLILRRRLSSAKFVESHVIDQDNKLREIPNIISLITLIIQQILLLLKAPLLQIGQGIEYILNLFSINGGLSGLICQIVYCSVEIPKEDSEEYRSLIGHIDGRMDLYNFNSLLAYNSEDRILSFQEKLELCMMSSKIAYENQAFVKNVVHNIWKMEFVGFYNFWNEFSETSDTQAFIFTDGEKNAKYIFVAFRGTEPFNAQDWVTDVDLAWLSMGKLGRVHLGFMKALGIQDAKDYIKGWPKIYTGTRDLAYYSIREKLKTLLEQNKGASILITGHSLGGALAALYPSILMLHKESDILSSLDGVYTFGQPRVGDKAFGEKMKEELYDKQASKRYHRVVYRYDLVPRVPFDDPISQFSHFGDCLYFNGWYKGEVMEKQPNENYFDPKFLVSKYLCAWLDLFRGVNAWRKPGGDFKEGLVSILYRIVGLFLPGIASHSPRDYVNATRLAQIKDDIGEEEKCMDNELLLKYV